MCPSRSKHFKEGGVLASFWTPSDQKVQEAQILPSRIYFLNLVIYEENKAPDLDLPVSPNRKCCFFISVELMATLKQSFLIAVFCSCYKLSGCNIRERTSCWEVRVGFEGASSLPFKYSRAIFWPMAGGTKVHHVPGPIKANRDDESGGVLRNSDV